MGEKIYRYWRKSLVKTTSSEDFLDKGRKTHVQWLLVEAFSLQGMFQETIHGTETDSDFKHRVWL